MVHLTSLWLPILVSAVIVFVASSIIHMLLPYHRSDVRKLPQEDEVLSAVRRLNVQPGDYCLPHPGSHEAMKNPEFIEKMKQGPRLLMTVVPGSSSLMTAQLVLWFL